MNDGKGKRRIVITMSVAVAVAWVSCIVAEATDSGLELIACSVCLGVICSALLIGACIADD